MESTNNIQKLKGFTIRALKCYIKALELGEGVRVSQRAFRYELSADGLTARVIRTADGSEVEGTKRTIEDWAKVGKPARLGLIGLKAKKRDLREQGARVMFDLNVISGEAGLTRDGERITKLPVPGSEEQIDAPTTIEGWAELGRSVEKPLFEQLKAAREWGLKDAEKKVWDEMVELGIVREKGDTDGSVQA
jgi:hypothetical protein